MRYKAENQKRKIFTREAVKLCKVLQDGIERYQRETKYELKRDVQEMPRVFID